MAMTADFARSFPAAPAELPGLIAAIEAWLEQSGVPADQNARLMVAFDEILSNIARYGSGVIDIAIRIDGSRLTTVITDCGPPFDPLARPAPDTDLGIDERGIGGLGIHLVRKMFDDVRYAYVDGQNRLSFGKML
jgi:serine/threonine-protein kinase RsbW